MSQKETKVFSFPCQTKVTPHTLTTPTILLLLVLLLIVSVSHLRVVRAALAHAPGRSEPLSLRHSGIRARLREIVSHRTSLLNLSESEVDGAAGGAMEVLPWSYCWLQSWTLLLRTFGQQLAALVRCPQSTGRE